MTALALFGVSCFAAQSLNAACAASASQRVVTAGGVVSVGSITIQCTALAPASGSVTVSANVDFANADAELDVNGMTAGAPSLDASNRLVFPTVELADETILRVSKLRVDLSGPTPPQAVVMFVSFSPAAVTNNVLTMAAVFAPCEYSLSPSAAAVDADGGSGTFDVGAPPHCDWSATTGESWISIVSGGGIGEGEVSYEVAENTAHETRSGVIRVGTERFSIEQAGVFAPCEFSLSPSSAAVDADGGSGTFDVGAPPHCDWSATTGESWISIVSGGGIGEGEVSYEVAENTARETRAGVIRVGTERFSIEQAGVQAAPDLLLSQVSAPTIGRIGEPLGTVAATILNMDAGDAGAFRVGFYFSEDETFGVGDRFSGATCMAPGLEAEAELECETEADVPATLAPGAYYLVGFVDDQRRVIESDEENNQLAGALIEITDEGPAVEAPAAVTSAATYEVAAAPGLFVSLFGEGWAEEIHVADSLPYPTELGKVAVLLDGEAIPLSMVSGGQINALLPYTATPGATSEIQVRRGEEASETLTLEVATAAPGILTTSQDGTGQAAALDSDYALADADSPVEAGELLQIYSVGLGAVDPPIDAGAAADPEAALYRTVAHVRLMIGGAEAEVLFSGLAPGFSGLYQVNGIVPDGVAPGTETPIQLIVEWEGGATTIVSNTATVAVADAM